MRPEPRVIGPIDVMRYLVAFALAPDGGDEDRRATWELDRVLMVAVPQMRMQRLQDLPVNERAVLRATLRSSLLAFVTRGPRMNWWAPLNVPLSITRMEVSKMDDGRMVLNFDGPFPAAFWFAAAVLVQSVGEHLSLCDRCGQMFVRERIGRGNFCSRECGNRKRATDYYRRNRDEVLERRHQRHEEKTKQRYPEAKRLKVARRPRQARKGRQR